MAKEARISVTLTGRHSLAPANVRDACRDIDDMLSKGTIPHIIHSSVPGLDLQDVDVTGHGEHISAKVEESTFDISWTARLPAGVPGAMVGAVVDCLQTADEVPVRASVTTDGDNMTRPRIGDGPLACKFTAIAFELDPPKVSQEPPGGHEARFFGMGVTSGKEEGSVIIFAERKSMASSLNRAVCHSLEALSSYCGACGK